MQHFIKALKLYGVFHGRSSRTEYWMFSLIYMLIYIVLAVLAVQMKSEMLLTVFSLAIVIPSISITTRRLHDTGRNGWWQLLMFIPIIGWVIVIIFLAQASSEGSRYGIKPKQL